MVVASSLQALTIVEFVDCLSAGCAAKAGRLGQQRPDFNFKAKTLLQNLYLQFLDFMKLNIRKKIKYIYLFSRTGIYTLIKLVFSSGICNVIKKSFN